MTTNVASSVRARVGIVIARTFSSARFFTLLYFIYFLSFSLSLSLSLSLTSLSFDANNKQRQPTDGNDDDECREEESRPGATIPGRIRRPDAARGDERAGESSTGGSARVFSQVFDEAQSKSDDDDDDDDD